MRESLAHNRPHQDIIQVLQQQMGMDEQRARRAIAYVHKNYHAAPLASKPPAAIPPTPQDDDALVQYVIAKMGRGVNINDIILHVVENSQMDWPQAQRFVARVSRDQKDHIAAKQAPIMLPLSVGAMILGAAMVVFSIVLFGILISGQYEFRRSRDLSSIVGIPLIFLMGFGLMVGGAQAVNSQLRALGATTGFYRNLQDIIDFLFRMWWLVAVVIGVMIVLAIVLFAANGG